MVAVWVLAAMALLLRIRCGSSRFRVEMIRSTIQGNVASPLKIAQLSDLHTHGMGARERRMLDILEDEKPTSS